MSLCPVHVVSKLSSSRQPVAGAVNKLTLIKADPYWFPPFYGNRSERRERGLWRVKIQKFPGENARGPPTNLSVVWKPVIRELLNDNDDGNENVCIYNNFALSARAVRFSFLSISLPSSAKKQCEMTKFEALGRTSVLEGEASFTL